MNKIIIRALLFVLLAAVILTPSCKAFVWDPTGIWQFPINYLAGPAIYNETLTFTGTDSTGIVTGYTFGGSIPANSGTYSKSGDFGLIISFDFVYSGGHFVIQLICNSSENSPNSMTGTGTFDVNSGVLYSAINVTATKTTNLQD